MIHEIEIEGFKSIEHLKLELGRVTVLIGENGCGKSNLLEAIAFASAADEHRLSHEFLSSRGIRSPEPRLMRPAFSGEAGRPMRIEVTAEGQQPIAWRFVEKAVSMAPSTWSASLEFKEGDTSDVLAQEIESATRELWRQFDVRAIEGLTEEQRKTLESALKGAVREKVLARRLEDSRGFLVFSPENSALRVFQREGQILPIGINGEGLFAHLRELDREDGAEILGALNERLGLIDWFDGFEVPGDLGPNERRLTIRDRYLPSGLSLDQRSANEGFLFLLFYYTLLLSPTTPKFFAIDNIDASLNPRLCARLMRDVVELAALNKRQVIVTTHNPAVLDGLDLTDDDQRLMVVSRSHEGATRVRRVHAPEPIEGVPPIRLSEAFIRGFLGGLPGNF